MRVDLPARGSISVGKLLQAKSYTIAKRALTTARPNTGIAAETEESVKEVGESLTPA